MGNRIIKETIRTSKSINALNDFQFRLWVYLLTTMGGGVQTLNC